MAIRKNYGRNHERQLLIVEGARANKQLLRLIKEQGLGIDELTEDHPIYGEEIKMIKHKVRLSRQVSDVQFIEIMTEKHKVHPRKTQSKMSRGKRAKERRAAEAYRWNNTYRYPECLDLKDPLDAERYRNIFLCHINSGMPKHEAEQYAIRDYYKNL